MKNFIILLCIAILYGCTQKPAANADRLVFTKTAENPVLGPDSAFVFWDPVKSDSVRWQKADVFNPAAVVKDQKVYLLYRAEDNPAAILGGADLQDRPCVERRRDSFHQAPGAGIVSRP